MTCRGLDFELRQAVIYCESKLSCFESITLINFKVIEVKSLKLQQCKIFEHQLQLGA